MQHFSVDHKGVSYVFEISATVSPLATWAIMSTLTVHCWWEGRSDSERGDWTSALICGGQENEVANTSCPLLPLALL